MVKLDIYNLYSTKWTESDLNPESFSHPAKASKGLLAWIFQHAIEQGYLVPGQTVILDPFGGVGTTAFYGLQYQCPTILNELEPHFHSMSNGCGCTGVSRDDYGKLFSRPKKLAYKGRYLCPQCQNELGRVIEPAIESPKKEKVFVLNGRHGKVTGTLRDHFQRLHIHLNSYKAKAVKEYYARKGLGKPPRLALKREPMIQPPLPISHQPRLFEITAPDTLAYERNSGRIPVRPAHHYVGNIERWQKIWPGQVWSLRGDSTKLGEVIQAAGIVISSPPYASVMNANREGTRTANDHFDHTYGTTPNQLGAMSIGSPPFTSSAGGDDPDKRGGLYRDPKRKGDKNLTGTYGNEPGQMGIMTVGSPPFAQAQTGGEIVKDNNDKRNLSPSKVGGYQSDMQGQTKGQLSALSIGSPPWAGNSGGQTEAARNGIDPGIFDRHQGGMRGGTGSSEGNLDSLPMGVMSVGSPPFIESIGNDKRVGRAATYSRQKLVGYGTSPTQLGNAAPTTFWEASTLIINQLYQILPPGGVSIWICKRFIKDGKVVDFSRQWADLCEYCGFELIEWIRAWQVSEVAVKMTLEGEQESVTKGGVSFFRNLVNQKHRREGRDEMVIENEDIIIVRKK